MEVRPPVIKMRPTGQVLVNKITKKDNYIVLKKVNISNIIGKCL